MNPVSKPEDAARSSLPEADLACVIDRAMHAARAAQAHWKRTPVSKRLRVILQLRRLIAESGTELAAASARPRSRPSLESLTAEVLPLAEAARFLEREAKRILAPRTLGIRGRPLWLGRIRHEIHREPCGVVLIIGPGNYPLLLPGVQVMQALTAGNAVLLKPGVGGTSAAQSFRDLAVRAGLDGRLLVILPESTAAARAAIDCRPERVLFTGSATTGELILKQLARHLIPATMELSGCDAVIIRTDADLDLAIRALQFGLTLNDGSTCLAPRRVFVGASRATELEGRLAQLSVHPITGETQNLHELVTDALARGAHLINGSIRADGSVLAPVILGGISNECRLLREEFMGPVLAVMTVANDIEAVAKANDCPYALGASVFTRDESAGRRLASRLRAGVVTINDLILPTADARLPFGGRARSGFGMTRGAEGLLELTHPKVVTISRGKFRPAFDSPQPGDVEMIGAYLRWAHGCGWRARGYALWAFLRALSRRQPSVKTHEYHS